MTVSASYDDARPMDRAVARQAAQWLMRLHEGTVTGADEEACRRWRAADPEHERAWQRAEHVSQKFSLIPSRIGMPALDRTRGIGRRAAINRLVLLMVGASLAYGVYRSAPWQAWTADYATATGERRAITLADGTRIHLNTATAIDVLFGEDQRLVVLRAGEISIETGADTAHGIYRPFVVKTGQGRIRALGTRFVVRQFESPAMTRATVLESAVEITPVEGKGAAMVLRAGEQASFTATHIEQIASADPHAAGWVQGVLYVSGMRLAEFAMELGRYRSGLLRCDPAVADLRITGVFQLDNTDSVLAALPDTLPVSVSYRSRYWVTIAAPVKPRI